MVATMITQLGITRESLFFGLVDNSQVWDGLVFQTVSDLAYFGLISIVAIAATASISASRR